MEKKETQYINDKNKIKRKIRELLFFRYFVLIFLILSITFIFIPFPNILFYFLTFGLVIFIFIYTIMGLLKIDYKYIDKFILLLLGCLLLFGIGLSPIGMVFACIILLIMNQIFIELKRKK